MFKQLFSYGLMLLLLTMMGCNYRSDTESGQHKGGRMMNITAQELMKRQAQDNKLILVDVRQPEELVGSLAALPNSVNIPLPELANRYQEIPTDKQVIVICRSGNRSSQAAHFLVQKGYQDVLNLQGGMLAVKQLNN